MSDKYARSCVRRLPAGVCGGSPATTVTIAGVGRLDLCARHAVEAMGFGKPIERVPPPDPKAVRKRGEHPLDDKSAKIIAYIVSHPKVDRTAIIDGTGIRYSSVGYWLPRLVKMGILQAIRPRGSVDPITYRVIALPPGYPPPPG